MADNTSFQVNYRIHVDATQGIEQVGKFADSIRLLNTARQSFDPAVTNINKMMQSIDKLFRDDKNRKKNFQYKYNIDTGKTEENLKKVVGLLDSVIDKVNTLQNKKINIDPGKVPAVRNTNNKKKVAGSTENETKRTALTDSKSVAEKQKAITKSIGKINAALISLEKGRKVNIDTDIAKQKLQELNSLLAQIRSKTNMSMSLGMGMQAIGLNAGVAGLASNPTTLMPISNATQRKLYEKLYIQQQLHQQRLANRAQTAQADQQRRTAAENARAVTRANAQLSRQQEADRRRNIANENRRKQEDEKRQRRRIQDEEKRQRRDAAQAVRQVQSQTRALDNGNLSRQRGAINRLQYAKAPSLRSLPMGYMFNAYMGYSLLKQNLSEAVEYSNIMESAHSILRVADTDLGTFERRFDNMARYVRQIGVETKFTAIEVAGAVKYLAMAGMGIETINNSIRPITDLALIGDNDISQIADLSTNIMAGYNIKSDSMSKVADILASTVSRSNVNIIEMAESYKMAAGYMKLSGVDFTETAAAIGILGNMGIKGTMAGTALRAMSTRFAKPPKEAQKTLDRLGVKFTYKENIYGEEVEKLRSLADIFEELKKKQASLEDMVTIFGKIGGNAGMMFLTNYEQLRTLASQNKASQGIASDLARVKQETTKGLWYQMTSMFSEGFMKGYEILEPQIKGVLKDFIEKFNTKEFSQGLTSIGNVLLDLLSALGKIATWFVRNFNWIEPLLFTGFVATRLFKLAGALTNVGVALGFIGKQSAASAALNTISGLTGIVGFGGARSLRGMSIADKRALITALRGAGVTGGRGALTTALAGMSPALLSRGGLFASQVTTGSGLIGASASLSAISASAVAATAGLSLLAGGIAYVAYKTWKLKEAKDAVTDEIESNTKFRYPSIDDLYDSLEKTYKMAKSTKKAVDDVTAGKTIEESSGHTAGAFTNNWWGVIGKWTSGIDSFHSKNAAYINVNKYDGPSSFADARQRDITEAIITVAKRDSQQRVNSAIAELSKIKEPYQVGGFINNIPKAYGQSGKDIDLSLYNLVGGVTTGFKEDILKKPEGYASKTVEYMRYQNQHTVKDIQVLAGAYQHAISGYGNAKNVIERTGFRFDEFEKSGFYQDKNGNWIQKKLSKNATEEEKKEQYANFLAMRNSLEPVTIALRKQFGESTEIAETILKKAGITSRLYSNEPDSNDSSPWDANNITTEDADDGGKGGNYSGTGKLSSAAPKQVIVNISNLMSVGTIDLLKSKDGQTAEIQNLKEQLAQALIDVVHDFDASWNG